MFLWPRIYKRSIYSFYLFLSIIKLFLYDDAIKNIGSGGLIVKYIVISSADGTTYDNGYGICMIPKTQVAKGQWNTSNTTAGGYKSSYMHTTVLPGIVTKLQRVLGSHIVQRNVLLSSSVDGNNHSNAYTWTTAYATLMSIGQMTGTFAANRNKYDDGEANYKLPIFNSKDFKTGYYFWSRGVCDGADAWYVHSGSIDGSGTNFSFGVRQLIYLR